jgi:hypothetical protein
LNLTIKQDSDEEISRGSGKMVREEDGAWAHSPKMKTLERVMEATDVTRMRRP